MNDKDRLSVIAIAVRNELLDHPDIGEMAERRGNLSRGFGSFLLAYIIMSVVIHDTHIIVVVAVVLAYFFSRLAGRAEGERETLPLALNLVTSSIIEKWNER